MKISDKRLDRIISRLTIEYNGCHAPHNQTPLYGRRAYWRIYAKGVFTAKITTPVKSMEPRAATLTKLFRAELRRRIECIRKRRKVNDYGDTYIGQFDPYNVRSLVKLGLE